MTETIKVSKLTRELQVSDLTVRKGDAGVTRLSFSASSEKPVERYFGDEVLSHDAGAVRLERLKAGAMPLLFNHDMGDPIGMVDAGSVKDGRLLVDAHLFATERAQEIEMMVEGGLRNVSIGYRLNVVEENVKTNTYTATDWEPYEISIVTVPADPSVGLGRAADNDECDVRMIREVSTTAQNANRRDAMTDQVNAEAGTSAEVQVRAGADVAGAEAGRIAGIKNLSKACKIDDRIRDMWISGGVGLDKVGEDINGIVAQREANNPQVASRIGLSDGEAKRFSFAKAIIAASTNNWNDAGFELECSRAVYQKLGKPIEANRFCLPFEVQNINRPQRRDLTVATSSAGGYLVATENQSFIELLRNRTVAYRLGATRLPGLVGNVTIPKQTGAATPVWLANEASTATESAQTFGQLALTPHTVSAYVEISRQLLLQSQPAAEQIAMTDVAAVAAIAVDLAVLNGSGASGQPTGIIGTAGIGAFTGTSLAAAGVLDAQSDVLSANVSPVSPGYVTTAAVAALLMARPELPTTGTTRLWQGSMYEGSLFNVPAMVSAQMSTATALFGDWSKVVVGEWGTLEVETNPYANFQAGIVGIRALLTMDVGVRYAGAFSYSSSIT